MTQPTDQGPFYHGTTAALIPGNLLRPGFASNYQPDLIMNHIYFTSLLDGAGFAAVTAAEKRAGQPHVYRIEPCGDWEDDPNVTDKKYPGNPTKSYRSAQPLRVLEEIHDFPRPTLEVFQRRFEKLGAQRLDEKGGLIN